jgi:hypothetical protein
MKRILVMMLIVGLIIVGVEVGKRQCRPKTVYRYIPRTQAEEEELSLDVEDVFRDMFQRSTPWIKSSTEEDNNVRRVVY